MRTILATALALAALTSAALADGAVELTDTQLDQITAGVLVDKRPTSDPGARPVPGGGAKISYFTPRIATSRVANPGVNVSFVPLDLDDVQNLF